MNCKNYKFTVLTFVIAAFLVLFSNPLSAAKSDDKPFDAGPFIIEHVTDSYGWHICGDGDKSVTIPLPIILVDNGHLVTFMSNKLHHGEAAYNGYAMGWGEQKGAIVKLQDDYTGHLEEGSEYAVDHVCKFNISITKNVCALFISLILISWIFLAVAKSYKRRPNEAPRGMQALVEPVIVFLQDEVINPSLGHHAEKYTPYLLTLFFFVFTCNLLGLIPLFPAGANITGNIAVTATLALITFIITNLSGNKHYWKEIFNNPEVPAYLKIFPLMPLVELVGVFTKPIVLMIRLFANMTAGHVISLGFVVIIFIISNSVNMTIGGAVATPISIFFQVFMGALDCLVSYIQAYVFTTLTALYIGMAVADPEEA